MQSTKLVSVIVPTYKSAATLEACLLSLKSQSYPNIEIIVVDNFSPDGTFEIAKKYASIAVQQGPERTTQKNRGIALSNGEYLCFIDSDMIVGSEVIAECVDQLSANESLGGLCIPECSVGEGFFVKVRDFERSFYAGTSVASARFFRKDQVVSVGGFEEDIIFFEESLLPQKIESKLGLDTSQSITALIEHQEWDISLLKWFKKKFYYWKSLGAYQEKVRTLGIESVWKWQTGVIGRYMIFFRQKSFYQQPILALAVLTLKTWEFAAGSLGYVVSKIVR